VVGTSQGHSSPTKKVGVFGQETGGREDARSPRARKPPRGELEGVWGKSGYASSKRNRSKSFMKKDHESWRSEGSGRHLLAERVQGLIYTRGEGGPSSCNPAFAG